MKICSACKESLPVSEFGKSKNAKDGLYPYCRPCKSAKARERWASSDKGRVSMMNAIRRNKYGLEPEDFEAMVKAQKGRCAICDQKPSETLCVDHDHATEEVRGLLCRSCNTALGQFKDDPHLLRAAYKYLRGSRGAKQSRTTIGT